MFVEDMFEDKLTLEKEGRCQGYQPKCINPSALNQVYLAIYRS